ncbi:MAG: hypothetical protein IKH15_06830 [Bacteroidales bacterium]|nr:hypothetical protein [Bacteroidales bacterium]
MAEKISRIIVEDPHGNTVDREISTSEREIVMAEHNADATAHEPIRNALNQAIAQAAQYSASALSNHNLDPNAHSDIRKLVVDAQAEAENKIETIYVGDETVVVEESGKKVVRFRKDQFGKVDGIKVNDVEQPIDEDGKVNIPVPTSVAELTDADDYATKDYVGENMPRTVAELLDADDYATKEDAQAMVDEAKVTSASVEYEENDGEPDASVVYNGGDVHFKLENMKMKFSDLKPEEIERITGPEGKQGKTVIYGAGDLVLDTKTGQDQELGMTQKAITDELIKKEKSIGEWEEIKVSLLPQANCYPSSAVWNMRTSGTGKNEQRHVVIPVSGGEQILLTCVSIKDNSKTGAKYAWLTSAYDDTPPQNGAALPLASGETEARDALIADGETMITAPTDAAYLCLTMVGWDGSAAAVTWEAKRKQQVQDLARQVKYNTEDLDNAMEWVEHRNDVQLAGGYINVNLKWNITSNWKGKVIPFEQYVGKRVKITRLSDNANLNFAFLTAMPSNVNLSSVAFCQGWEGVIKEEYDDYVPEDCKYLYVLAKNGDTSADVTPYVKTREMTNKPASLFVKSEDIDLSNLIDNLCSIGADKFYMNTSTNEQRHIAIPVIPGEIYRVRSIDGDGQMIVATSDYDNILVFQNDTPIPTAEGWDARVGKQEYVCTIPPDGAYILLTTVNGAGIRCTHEVEKGTLVSTPLKDLPTNVPVKLRVVQWNIGGFTKGANGGDQGYNYKGHEADFYTDLPVWKDTINDMNADIICCCEYNKVMLHGEGGEPDVIARDEIFGLYKHAYIQPKLEDYNMKAIFSHMAAKGLTRTLFPTHRNGSQPYYETVRYKVNNNDVYVIATHLDWSRGDTDTSYRQGQMEELMAFAADKQYVIICADFNAGAGDVTEEFRRNGSKEYDQWLEAGFKMANHGYLGDFNTGSKVYSVLDNIIVKGFDVSNIKIYDDPNNTSKQVELVQEHQLSDHAAIGCTLTMLD